MSYRAALIGCGLIGSEFSDTATLPGVWSHAAAYAACPDTELVAICDPDDARLDRCGERWNVAARYSDFAQMLDAQRPEIVSICTPDHTHYALIRTALEHPAVRAVLAEKPLALNLEQADELVKIAAARRVILAVNYSRRYAPGFVRLREMIAAGALGAIQAVSGFYTKGTLHNGSHWFDLANFLIGPTSQVIGINRRGETGEDPTLDVMLEFECGAAGYLHGCDAAAYALFEMDIVGSRGRARIVDSGFVIEIYGVEASPFGAGYRKLVLQENIDGGLPQAMLRAVEDTARCISDGGIPKCAGADALQALKIGLAAHRSAQTGQTEWIRGS
ncbi:MAG: Gfo/Idh/MocA family oxidoreductase [Gammaproteobacteria bacterium]|nr:Gfo/Idh/MocA family oxidoreductase [Gammaproteobacteria bacterium]